MTVEEMDNMFDVLYNNITSNQAPGLNAYEKSVFLTKAIIAAAEGEEKNEPAEVASVVAEDEADVQNNHKTSEYSHQKSEQFVKEEHKDNYHAQSHKGLEQSKQEQDMPMADGILESHFI